MPFVDFVSGGEREGHGKGGEGKEGGRKKVGCKRRRRRRERDNRRKEGCEFAVVCIDHIYVTVCGLAPTPRHNAGATPELSIP